MHLLNIQSGSFDEDNDAVDLGQDPADIIIISAADTELANLSASLDPKRHASLRLANFLQLKHPLSVDHYIENTLKDAKIVVLRLLGGLSYWRYGVEQIYQICVQNQIKLCILPGDKNEDESLLDYNLIEADLRNQIWQYFNHGGSENGSNLLSYLSDLISDQKIEFEAAKAIPNAQYYWPHRKIETLDQMQACWQDPSKPIVLISFYKALLDAANTAPIDAIIVELEKQGLNPLPIYVSSLKEKISQEFCLTQIEHFKPDMVLNLTSFAVGSFDHHEVKGDQRKASVLEAANCPILQLVLSSQSREVWDDNVQGLNAKDLAMNVALTEVDGRILSRAISFKEKKRFDENTKAFIAGHEPDLERIEYVVKLTKAWVDLRKTDNQDKNIALILANYPNKNARIGNGVGLDAPQSAIDILTYLKDANYQIDGLPETGTQLIEQLKSKTTNAFDEDHQGLINKAKKGGLQFSASDYQTYFEQLPQIMQKEVNERWGDVDQDPFMHDGIFHLPVQKFGNAYISIQPARGYNIDPKSSYHDPDLVPPHGYFAHYFALRHLGVMAYIHCGKHGNLEWLPGKALALSENCYPEAAQGAIPNIYPFIVNDPGEGTQAKRRTSAVILDHLTPPLTRAESYGDLKDLESLADEFFLSTGMDQRRLESLADQIIELAEKTGMAEDFDLSADDDRSELLNKIDSNLCDLKELQIRDGLHIYGSEPIDLSDEQHWLKTNTLVALARVPRAQGEGEDQSLIRAIAQDLGLKFDPLDCEMADIWDDIKPDILFEMSDDVWRINGDTIERIEILAQKLVKGEVKLPQTWSATQLVLEMVDQRLRPLLRKSADQEMLNMKRALAGEFIEPGSSGAPSRGRLDVLPTGRNFFSIDSRSLPTPTAWRLGKKSAENLMVIHAQTHGQHLKSVGMSLWGTANMRTGGDDLAQAMALLGVKPKWDKMSWRVTGFDIIPLAKLNRPRVDVTLRISGFFRDSFPQQIDLFDQAVRAVAALDEPDRFNPIKANFEKKKADLMAQGLDEMRASQIANIRIFGSKPGAYGAGLQALIDEDLWEKRSDFADAFLAWGSFAYGKEFAGERQQDAFESQLKQMDATIQNQDNREHDLLDSDDYYQFEGGMAAAVESLKGDAPISYHNDHSRPEKPVIRTLDQELARVMRGRVVNPKWLDGVMRHGYKGAFEMAASVDYLYAFAATTNSVKSHHFEMVYQAYIEDQQVYDFLKEHNMDALNDILKRLKDALEKQFWKPKRNSAYYDIEQLLFDHQVKAK